MFRRIREFHRKTMEIYNKDIEENLEPWKKRVMKIHEDAEFLFYAEEIDDDKERGACMIRGDLVRGEGISQGEILFLDGEGNVLATALITGEPKEKEEHHRGLIHHRRNLFPARILTIGDADVSEMSEQEYRRRFLTVGMNLSLIADPGVFS